MDRVPILQDGREVSHLAVHFDVPATADSSRPGLCFLYLHGFGSVQTGEKAEFFRQSALESGFPFCSFDFQGHGQSGGTMRDLTLSRNLYDIGMVQAWLRERGHDRICLIGSSMGGGSALWYSALHPDGICAGLHIAPALELEKSLVAWAGPEGCRRWEETGAIHFENDLVSCELGWELIRDLRAYSYEELLRIYNTPALLLQGRKDASVPWRGVLDFATRCSTSEIDLHLFLDGDHRLTDRKQRLWDLMLEFLHGRGMI
jgi:pimeloyl-ACP methyl ester carboxylesterase